MTDTVLSPPFRPKFPPETALKRAAQFWFIVTVIGQWIFLYYVLALYGGSAVSGNIELWDKALERGYVQGATLSNTAIVAHMALAVIILGLGPLQIMPQIRARFPVFHRWSGRLYVTALVTTAVAGLYMLAGSTIGGVPLRLGFILQGIMIVAFAFLAVKNARARKFVVHRRWALRLFMVASAVWFFRVILMIWLPLTGGLGVDLETGQGPALDAMSFGQYLPLVILEFYFRAQDSKRARPQYIMAGSLAFMTVLMAGGIGLSTAFMWAPYF